MVELETKKIEHRSEDLSGFRPFCSSYLGTDPTKLHRHYLFHSIDDNVIVFGDPTLNQISTMLREKV